MAAMVIVLNGGSSSGKSTLARRLQAILPTAWLTFSIDALIEAMPPAGAGIDFTADGGVTIGPGFRNLEAAWMRGIAAMARAGAPVIVDDVFLGGAASQARWRAALTGLDTRWVGVRCDPDTAVARESTRPDRNAGMARSQATVVHDGVRYDIVVDTTHTPAADCARTIAEHLGPNPENTCR